MMTTILFFIECIIFCAILFFYCYFGKKKSPVNLVYLYEKDVQERVVSMGLITQEKIKNNAKLFKIIAIVLYVIYLPVCVVCINGARGFREIFLQMLGILAMEGFFDRIIIDTLWVGCTRAWIIPGTEDLMPYISAKVHIRKWIVTVLMYPAIAALLAGVFSLATK